ncbi:MAG: hypothetical protein FJ030_00470 [Chloroflexi bacterium]|nr:hypothetical protein [Chloroflexota bacterium]
METDSNDKPSHLETAVALLIAVATVIGAVVAWRASVAADGAGDADFAGLKASLNAEETRSRNFVNAYEHYGAYTAYAHYSRLGDLIGQDLESDASLSDEEAFRLDRDRGDAYDLAKANQDLFPNRFLNRAGEYNVQREIAEQWADASREKDLYPDPHYAEADKLRGKTNQLLAALAVVAMSLVFYTLVEAAGPRFQIAMAALGTLFLIGGAAAAIFFELGR